MLGFEMFELSANNGMTPASPNDWYRNIEQAFITAQWENTTSLTNIQEQNVNLNQDDYFENFEFTPIEVWVNTVVGQSSTGSKTGYDFIQIIFQNIDHLKIEGRYYIINDQYYIAYFDNRIVDVDANISVRRCNEWMRIVDPMNGSVYQIPCVVDYDMSAPSNKVTNDIITPNNHAVVKVQQNAITERLFTTNKRFILGGRPFKITGLQNAVNQFIDNSITSSMGIDLFLDEIWEKDNLIDGIADNGVYAYSINIGNESLNLTKNATGALTPVVMLNGEEVNRVVEWSSSDETVVSVDEMGQFVVLGEDGAEAEIVATLYGNTEVSDSIQILVVSEEEVTTDVLLNPSITFIREHDSVAISILGEYNGNSYIPDSISIEIPEEVQGYLGYVIDGNIVTLTCIKRYKNIVNLNITVSCSTPAFTASRVLPIKLTSLLG